MDMGIDAYIYKPGPHKHVKFIAFWPLFKGCGPSCYILSGSRLCQICCPYRRCLELRRVDWALLSSYGSSDKPKGPGSCRRTSVRPAILPLHKSNRFQTQRHSCYGCTTIQNTACSSCTAPQGASAALKLPGMKPDLESCWKPSDSGSTKTQTENHQPEWATSAFQGLSSSECPDQLFKHLNPARLQVQEPELLWTFTVGPLHMEGLPSRELIRIFIGSAGLACPTIPSTQVGASNPNHDTGAPLQKPKEPMTFCSWSLRQRGCDLAS